MNDHSPMKKILDTVTIIAFVADLITIGIFVRDLFSRGINQDGISHIIIIVIIFLFAYLLLTYSQSEQGKDVSALIYIFGWIYITFSAAILGIFSFYYLNGYPYSFWNYISYFVIVIFIALLGFSIFRLVKENFKYLSIPFLIITVEQIIIWVQKILSSSPLAGSILTFIGSIFLFLLASSTAIGLIYYDHNIIESDFEF